jgi:hypothetical protein
MKTYPLAFIIFILISCNKKEIKVESEKLAQKITIDTFTFDCIPDGMDGAGCYFNDLEKNEYIFVNDFDKTSFMKINGKLEKFNLIKSDSLSDKKSIYYYKNSNYDLEVTTKDSLQIDYNTILTGKLKLKSKDNQIIEKKFIGECGC